MRSIIVSLTILILLSGQAVFSQQPAVRADLLQKLIDLPAPAPFDPPKGGGKTRERPPDFDEDDNVPPDDAPIEDLLDYWSRNYNGLYTAQYIPTPSKKTVERILEYCEENPGSMSNYLSMLPSTPEVVDAVKRISDKMRDESQGLGAGSLQEWLKFHSDLYIGDLVSEANAIRDVENYVPLKNQYALRALAEVDWDQAQPILRRLESDTVNPASVVLAKWVVYRHAMDTGDTSTATTYREQLQQLAADKNAHWKMRDMAMDALTHSPAWDGREEWYFSLLEDETLLAIEDHGWTGLTTLLLESPRKEWIGKMIELTESKNITVRTAAVRNLMTVLRKGDVNILKALLPWLADPAWSKVQEGRQRVTYIRTLGETVVPEAVPGLISLLLHDEDMRDLAIEALTMYRDPRAAQALRTMLYGTGGPERRLSLISALRACGGFSDDEQMAALQAFVLFVTTEAGRQQVENYVNFYDGRRIEESEEGEPAFNAPSLPMQISIGHVVAKIEEPSEGLVIRAAKRLKTWTRTNPRAAAILAALMRKWQGRAVYAESLRRLKAGESDIDSLIAMLTRRKAIREAFPADMSPLRGTKGMARGIGSCLSEDPAEYTSILEETDAEAQRALLGCARLIRAELPVSQAAKLLKSANKLLAQAAERYLESEDSLKARKLVLANHKGAAMILGARAAFIPDVKLTYSREALAELFNSVREDHPPLEDFPHLEAKEQALRKELAAAPSIINIYALLTAEPAGHNVIRLYKDRAVFSHYENGRHYRQRDLSEEEYKGFIDLLINENIDSQKPDLSKCGEDCVPGEFVMFNRDGGRRIFVKSILENPVFTKLQTAFESFRMR
jgi:hypothetical protein